jgi:hypothetical protein
MSEQVILAALGAAALGAIGGRFGGTIWDRTFNRPKAPPAPGVYSHALCREKHAQIERRLDECERELEKGGAQFEKIQMTISDGFAEIRAFMAVIRDRDRRGGGP